MAVENQTWYVNYKLMTGERTLTSVEIREIGGALFGVSWQGRMASAIGVPRQSIGYYLKSGGVDGAQAAAIIGLVARMGARELKVEAGRKAVFDSRQEALFNLLHRFDSR